MKTQAIILTAGEGRRIHSQVPKALIQILDKPIFIHTLEVFEQSALIDNVILVVPLDKMSDFERFIKEFDIKKVTKIVAGGPTRNASVYNGLNVVDHETEIVLIHDGVRPFVSTDLIDRSLEACQQEDAVIVGVPLKSTIKKVDENDLTVQETLNRNLLWEVQTPQVFKKDVLLKAHEKGKGSDPTDDASLIEEIGGRVKVVNGEYKNIKITTQDDLVIARAFLKEAMEKNPVS